MFQPEPMVMKGKTNKRKINPEEIIQKHWQQWIHKTQDEGEIKNR
jgi:hypothetical protein